MASDRTVGFKVSAKQFQTIQNEAEKLGLSVSDYLRLKVLEMNLKDTSKQTNVIYARIEQLIRQREAITAEIDKLTKELIQDRFAGDP